MFSIIIPVFNRKNQIKKTLKSICEQSFTSYECIVVDDYSSDGIQEEFNHWGLDSRFVLIRNERSKGAQGARNTGLLQSKGRYLCFFDSDNLMNTYFLERVFKKFEEDSFDAVTCFSSFFKMGLKVGGMSYINSDNVLNMLLMDKTYIDFNSLVISKSYFVNNIGLLDENIVSYQELDLAFRLALTARFGTIKDYLINYILDGEDRISASFKKGILGKIYIYSKYNSIVSLKPLYKIKIWVQIIREYNKHCKKEIDLKSEIISELKKVNLNYLKFLLF